MAPQLPDKHPAHPHYCLFLELLLSGRHSMCVCGCVWGCAFVCVCVLLGQPPLDSTASRCELRLEHSRLLALQL